MNSPYERIVLSWADFKALLIKKNPHHQHIESDTHYSIWFDEYPTRYYCAINLANSPTDKTDFDDNYKAASNWAIPTRPYAFATGDFDFAPKAGLDTCPAGGSKSVWTPMCGTKYLNGGRLITDGNAAFGDWINMKIVDHDNVLGYGVDFSLKEWCPKWYVDYHNRFDSIETAYAGLPPNLMYSMFTYNSVGGTDVGFAFNLLMHKAI